MKSRLVASASLFQSASTSLSDGPLFHRVGERLRLFADASRWSWRDVLDSGSLLTIATIATLLSLSRDVASAQVRYDGSLLFFLASFNDGDRPRERNALVALSCASKDFPSFCQPGAKMAREYV